jgi:hypothetical protein
MVKVKERRAVSWFEPNDEGGGEDHFPASSPPRVLDEERQILVC